MNGVILYADDDVLTANTFENKLFSKFNNDEDYSVLPITNIKDLETAVKSVSTIRALLLDWEFKRPKENEDLEDLNLPNNNDETPLKFLKQQRIYSLIYIYSRSQIPDDIKKELKDFHGRNKVFFELKSSGSEEDSEYHKISKGIADFEEKNKHMDIPVLWSQSINQSVQSIFFELESADSNWIKEIRDTAKNDGGEPTSEVINIFHNLVNESIIQNKTLRDALDYYNCKNESIPEENTAKLYQRIFYTKIANDAPIMTGDIFKFTDNEYGILITPECDLSDKEKNTYEFLIIKKDASNQYQKDKREKYKKDQKSAKQIFNNGVIGRHLLISFPFDEDVYDNIAVIDFSSAIGVYKQQDEESNHIIKKRTSYKLNSPYIHQLRQRFVAFFGRYGVPAIPESLRDYNLKEN